MLQRGKFLFLSYGALLIFYKIHMLFSFGDYKRNVILFNILEALKPKEIPTNFNSAMDKIASTIKVKA
jgi:hypothetical protein